MVNQLKNFEKWIKSEYADFIITWNSEDFSKYDDNHTLWYEAKDSLFREILIKIEKLK